jgi:glycosyltransferase involved in cell wall biosynthesis
MPLVYRNVNVITVSPSSKKDIMEFELTLQEPEIIYNGVDLQTYKPGQKSAHPLVIYMGRLKQYKTVDVFIKAAKKILEKVPDAEFIIGGDGDARHSLVNLVNSLNLQDKVQFLGKISEEQKIKLLQRAWVAVNPSSMEGWGITVIEANACGTPVVAARVPGLMDSVKNPHTGYLVEHGDVDMFAEKILELLQDKNKRHQFSDAAVKWSKKFDWNESADKSLKLFDLI